MTELGHTLRALLRQMRAHRGKLEEHRRGGFIVRPWNGGSGYWFPAWVVRQAVREGYVADGRIKEAGLAALRENEE